MVNKVKKMRSKSSKSGSKEKGRFKVAYTNRKETKLMLESGSHELMTELSHPWLCPDEMLRLSSWGLPPLIVWKYKVKGVSSLFHWQLECLANAKVLDGRNLVYSAPTSAGKTLVAEILMVKRVLELGKKAIMILPFVSVAREKMYSLQDLFGDAGIRVEGMMGSYSPPGGFSSVDIAVCTIEKANGLINRLLEEGTLWQVGTIVVDELHLIGDSDRGYILELLLTKIKFMQDKQQGLSVQNEHSENYSQNENLNIQVIGMSATLPNLDKLAEWLRAELVVTDYRPVPLLETIKIDDTIYDQSLNVVRQIPNESLQVDIPNDPDHIVYLSLETVLNGHSILIFCPTRALCEKTAEKISRNFRNIGNPNLDQSPGVGARLREQLNAQRISEVLAQLKQISNELDDSLVKSVSFGVCFHHAGLSMDERDIIESAFKHGTLRVIVATSTLSAGVNLPARRVIVSSPMNYNNKEPLDIRCYKQMCGRAGRKGIDDEGESILICCKSNQHIGESILRSNLPAVASTLLGDAGALTMSMKRALLEVIASGVAKTHADLQNYAKCTLLSATTDFDVRENWNWNIVIQQCLRFLMENDFVRLRRSDCPEKSDEYMGTQLGSACLASSLSPDESLIVFKELQKARECFVLENELHIVYQVIPIYLTDIRRDIDWFDFLKLFGKLAPHEKRVGKLVGVEDFFMVQGVRGLVSLSNAHQAAKFAIHQRFFIALALQDLVNEVPIAKVSKKFELSKGQLQNLQQGASTFAGMVTAFCSRLGWSNLELLLSQFQPRLQFGVQRELCDLLRLSCLNGQLARTLYNAGVKSLMDLVKTDSRQVKLILQRAVSFSSSAGSEEPVLRTIRIPGKDKGLTEEEVSIVIVREARQFFQVELGLGSDVEFGLPFDKTGIQGLSKSTKECFLKG